MKTALYRHFDCAGALLYVGISNDTLRRLCQHKDRSHWFAQIARVDIEWMKSRQDALAAEEKAVKMERPKFNIRLQQKPEDSSRPDWFAVYHPATGRLNGWFKGRHRSEHMLGWFRATFQADKFALIRPRIGDHSNFIPRELDLKPSEWAKWAASEPDWSEGDKFDKAAA